MRSKNNTDALPSGSTLQKYRVTGVEPVIVSVPHFKNRNFLYHIICLNSRCRRVNIFQSDILVWIYHGLIGTLYDTYFYIRRILI